MDAYQSYPVNLTYSDEHPVLVVASSDSAMAHAERSIEASQLRVGAKLSIDVAVERIATQPKASVVWIELDRDCGTFMDEVLNQINADVSDSRYGAVVSATRGLLDPVSARISDSAVELIVDADDDARVAALAIATAQHQIRSATFDVARDKNAERLRQLSEEVGRIASTLARLSTGPGPSSPIRDVMPVGEAPQLHAKTVQAVIRARRLRARYFSEELFADPAWDMLLDLLQAEIEQMRVPVSSLCIAAAVPATTALRWLKTLVSQSLFIRRADPHDGRRIFVELAPQASDALRRYFAEVGPAAVI